jgi:hypothetical protein
VVYTCTCTCGVLGIPNASLVSSMHTGTSSPEFDRRFADKSRKPGGTPVGSDFSIHLQRSNYYTPVGARGSSKTNFTEHLQTKIAIRSSRLSPAEPDRRCGICLNNTKQITPKIYYSGVPTLLSVWVKCVITLFMKQPKSIAKTDAQRC